MELSRVSPTRLSKSAAGPQRPWVVARPELRVLPDCTEDEPRRVGTSSSCMAVSLTLAAWPLWFIALSMAAGKMMGLRGEPWAPPTSKDFRA